MTLTCQQIVCRFLQGFVLFANNGEFKRGQTRGSHVLNVRREKEGEHSCETFENEKDESAWTLKINKGFLRTVAFVLCRRLTAYPTASENELKFTKSLSLKKCYRQRTDVYIRTAMFIINEYMYNTFMYTNRLTIKFLFFQNQPIVSKKKKKSPASPNYIVTRSFFDGWRMRVA